MYGLRKRNHLSQDGSVPTDATAGGTCYWKQSDQVVQWTAIAESQSWHRYKHVKLSLTPHPSSFGMAWGMGKGTNPRAGAPGVPDFYQWAPFPLL